MYKSSFTTIIIQNRSYEDWTHEFWNIDGDRLISNFNQQQFDIKGHNDFFEFKVTIERRYNPNFV